jgi:exodeoxyribonuclease VIII
VTDYDQIRAVNWSRLKLMQRSPRHYRDGYAEAGKDSAARRLGRLVHLLTLEPELAPIAVAVWRGQGTRASKAYKEWAAALPDGVEEVTESEYDAAAGMADSVRAHPVASVLLSAGEAEVVLHWVEDVDGHPVTCKGRADWLVRSATPEQAAAVGCEVGAPILLDLKTCGSVDPREVRRYAASQMTHGQMAHYAAGVESMLGRPLGAAVMVSVETRAPHDVACDLMPPDEALYGGSLLRMALLRRLVECERNDEWPGTAPALRRLDLPAWAPGWEHDTDDEAVVIEEG